MKRFKIIATAVVFAFSAFAFADEFDDFGGFDSFDEGASSEPAVTISGSAEIVGRVYTDQRDSNGECYDLQDSITEGNASGRLNFDYSGASSDISFKLKFDKFSLGDYKEDILDELTARAYLGNLQLEAGKMKVVWGKGDKVHVLDNFNANDYTDFITPDYIDRRIAEPMFRLVYSTPSNIRFEGIWTPTMTVDRLADSGIWQPRASKTLTTLVEGIVKHNYGALIDSDSLSGSDMVNGLMELSSFSSDNLVEDNIKTIKYGQAGARTTFTLGHFDLGLSYYYGHYKQPSPNLGAYIDSIKTSVLAYASTAQGQTAIATAYNSEITQFATYMGTNVYGAAAAAGAITYVSPVTGDTVDLTNPTAISVAAQKDALMKACSDHAQEIAYMSDQQLALPSLNYNQLQVFGIEAATVLWKFNIRGEAAYYLTEDTAGDNPWIQNNSIQWVAGFDIDMPWTNMNLNVQTQGKYILNSDKIKDGAYSTYDVDYNSDDKYISNKVIVDLTDSYDHENIKIDLKGIFEIETKDFIINPSLTIKAVDDFSVTVSGMWINTENENSEFFNFKNNSYAQISCKYLF